MDDTIDFDPTRIENLCVDEIKIAERIANELAIRLCKYKRYWIFQPKDALFPL